MSYNLFVHRPPSRIRLPGSALSATCFPKTVPNRARSCHSRSFPAESRVISEPANVPNDAKTVQSRVKPVPKVPVLALRTEKAMEKSALNQCEK
jgi:hypothetical protein